MFLVLYFKIYGQKVFFASIIPLISSSVFVKDQYFSVSQLPKIKSRALVLSRTKNGKWGRILLAPFVSGVKSNFYKSENTGTRLPTKRNCLNCFLLDTGFTEKGCLKYYQTKQQELNVQCF